MPHLSLLSRGAGQVVRKTQEKLEVHFEPEDYFNWKSSERRCYDTRALDDSKVMEGSWSLYLPKTYSTKTGALVLYSEDLAKPSRKLRKSQQIFRSKSRALHVELHTLRDLVRAILAYGGKQARRDRKETAGQPYLHFLRDPAIQPDRQMRPGYSAKRYLLKLLKVAQTWDPNILQKLQCAGYIKDPFVLEDNVQYHRRKQDLSAVPPKYNLLPVFCPPCSYPWAEMEKANPGLGLSSSMKSENEARLVDGYKGEQHARRKPPIPFRISVRKLSFHLSPPDTKGSTWRQKASYGGTAENPNVGVDQNLEAAKEGQDQTESANQSTDCPVLEKIRSDTLDLWREKPHVTFYGGFFPGRKISDSVNQRKLKNSNGREGGPSHFLPLIQTGTSSNQNEARNTQRKQMPEIFRLPVISEDQLSAHRGKLKSRELPKELAIFPLLVRLEREPHTKRKNTRAGFDRSGSEAYVCDKLLALSSDDHVPEPGHRNKQRLVVSSEIPQNPQCSFSLPPISNGEFTLSRTKTRKRDSGAETNSPHQRGYIQDGVPMLGPLSAITRKKDPGDQDKRAVFETSTITSAGINGVCKDLPVGITNTVMQEKLGECHTGTSLSSLPVGRDGENVCPSPLGSVQATRDPEYLEFVPVEEVDGTGSLEAKIGVSRNLSEISFSAPELDEKVNPQTQEVGRVPETESCPPNEQSTMGNGSTGAESRKEIQQIQDGFHGNNLLLQRKQKKGHSGLPKTQVPKQKEGTQVPSKQLQGRSSRGKARLNSTPLARSSRDIGKEVENLPQSDSFSRLEPSLSQWMIPESEMDLDSAVWEFPGLEMELSIGMGIHSSEYQAEAGENNNTTLPEKPSLQTGRSSADDGLANKLITRQKKPELKKDGPGSKAQKKSPKNDKRHSRAEFVVGKPKQKKAVGKTASFSKEKADIKNSEALEETDEQEEEEQKEAEAEAKQIVSGAEEDALGEALDKSTSPALSLTEEGPLPPDDGQPFPTDVEHPSGFHTDKARETPTANSPIVYTAVGSQTIVVPNGELPEVLPVTEREKLSRERIIAERAEKRRLAVERKRREQEEQKWKQQEEQERMERMKEEMEEERWRRIEEIRLRKQQLQEEHQRQEEEVARKLQAEKAAQERFRQQQEELRRKLLEAQKKKEEEDRNRAEVEKRQQKEREMWLEEERRRVAEMAEEQRVEYEKRKREEEERARHEAEERRKKAEEAARLSLEEARKQALLLARQRAEQEQKQQFQHTLFVEASGLERRQDISRPWVYSYFQHPFLKVGDEE
uniref:uncharacterized protein KIAA2012 homolog n=1 Tax=Euleptes europaea TaxID=460621 RepID=UPI0025415FED|nr:uncharacterized protein KIAA2012 homolog [Euleptes europaea]